MFFAIFRSFLLRPSILGLLRFPFQHVARGEKPLFLSSSKHRRAEYDQSVDFIEKVLQLAEPSNPFSGVSEMIITRLPTSQIRFPFTFFYVATASEVGPIAVRVQQAAY